MTMHIENLPDWSFEVVEVSAGVYKVSGKHRLGPSVELIGEDPDALMEQTKEAAKKIGMELLTTQKR